MLHPPPPSLAPPRPTPRAPAVVAALATLTALLSAVDVGQMALGDLRTYAALHVLLELPSIALSLATFLLAWNTLREGGKSWIGRLGAPFLAIGLLDVLHAMSYGGMPPLLGHPSPQAAIVFWLASRYVAFGALLWVAWSTHEDTRTPERASLAALAGVLLLTAAQLLVPWALPTFYVPGQGLTPTKLLAEQGLIALGLLALVGLQRRLQRAPQRHRPLVLWLAAGVWCHVLAEFAFTRYAGVTDLANLLGHLLKIAGDLAVFQSLFVASVREPLDTIATLQKHQERLLAAMPDPWLLLAEDGTCLDHSRGEALPLGATDLSAGADVSALLLPRAARAARDAAEQARRDGRTIQRTVQQRGSSYELTALRLEPIAGHPDPVLLLARDVTAQRQAEAAVERLAYYDSLTGLPNRRLFSRRLDEELRAAQRRQRLGAVIFLDLDHFKHLNDTQGHAAEDRLLELVATRLASRLRGEDLIARLGGDEFVVLLRELGPSQERAAGAARRVAEGLSEALAEPFVLELGDPSSSNYTQVHAGASIGIALFGADAQTAAEVLGHADFAMYQAKEAGRGTVRFFDPELQQRLVRRTALAEALVDAGERGELWIAWQPQVLGAGAPCGAELLMRWTHPEFGFVSPQEFIPIAEDSDLIVGLGAWTLQVACEALARWAEDPCTADLTASVNVSGRQLYEDGLVADVVDTLRRTGARPERLVLELTETMVLRDQERARKRLEELSALGVRLSLDDFGTGYSSLAVLRRLPFDEVKIDRDFVLDLPDDADSAAIVETVLSMTEALGIEVVAEGVETEEQAAFLRERGCQRMQGYLYGKPMPHGELHDWLGQRR